MRDGAKSDCSTAGGLEVAGGRRSLRRVAWILAATASWCGGASAQLPAVADVVMPGTKRIQYTMSVEPSPLLAGRKLAMHRRVGSHGWSRIEPGEPFSSSSKYGTCIHLLVDGAEQVLGVDGACAASCMTVDGLRTTGDHQPVLSTLEGVHTTLRVARCTDDELVLEVVAHDRRHDPWMIAGYAFVLALGVACARWAWSRRARAR